MEGSVAGVQSQSAQRFYAFTPPIGPVRTAAGWREHSAGGKPVTMSKGPRHYGE